MKKPQIVVVGSSNTDMVIKVERIPEPGETVLGGEFSMAAGGKGANQAVAAARAGGEVTFIACVGEDMFGEQAIEGFVQDGINVEYISKDPNAASGVALIFVDKKGENSIAVASGANANLLPDQVMRAKDAVNSADILIMQLETPIGTVRAAAALASAPAPALPALQRLPPGRLLADRARSGRVHVARSAGAGGDASHGAGRLRGVRAHPGRPRDARPDG